MFPLRPAVHKIITSRRRNAESPAEFQKPAPPFVFSVLRRGEARSVKRISDVIDFLAASFDAKRFLWFGEDVIYPNEMEKYFTGENKKYGSEGFVERDDEPGDGAELH